MQVFQFVTTSSNTVQWKIYQNASVSARDDILYKVLIFHLMCVLQNSSHKNLFNLIVDQLENRLLLFSRYQCVALDDGKAVLIVLIGNNVKYYVFHYDVSNVV